MADTTPNNVSAGQQPGRDAESNKPTTHKTEPKKIVRLLTVVAYMMSVSMAALMLSAYYIFLWNPKEHRPHGPLRLVDPCPDCYLPAGGINHHQLGGVGAGLALNESQIAETPRALPAVEELPQELGTTPLSQLVLQYQQLHLGSQADLELDNDNDNDTLPVLVNS